MAETLPTLSRAIQFHQNNCFDVAAELYKSLLFDEPANAKALQLFGTLKYQTGQITEALELLYKSLTFNPINAEALNILGLIHESINAPEKAKQYYLSALEIEPSKLSVKSNLGVLYTKLGDPESAVQLLTSVFTEDNNSPDSAYNLALCFQKMDKDEEATKLYHLVLSLEPNHASALNNLGIISRKSNDFVSAEKYLISALRIDSANTEAKYTLSALYTETGRLNEAESLLFEVLSDKPDHYDAWITLGEIKFREFQFDKAIEIFTKSFQIDKNRWDAPFNIGVAYQEMGEPESSLLFLNQAIALASDNYNVHLALAEILFTLKNFSEGWTEYEYRLEHPIFLERNFTIPKWNGEPLLGKSIFIFEEQGSGDTFQYLRYLRFLKEAGAKIIFQAKSHHHRLLVNHKDIDLLIDSDTIPDFEIIDFYSPLLSIPRFIWEAQQQATSLVPYINTSSITSDIAGSINFNTSKMKIGISWCGNTYSKVNKKRHCTLSDILPLLNIKGVQFYSLQVGTPADELKLLDNSIEIIDASKVINDYADTAEIIANMDLVITIDSSIAHLAGAMGKKTFLMLAKVPDWRWIQNSSKSEWYPNTTLFPQDEYGDWSGAVQKVKEEILTQYFPGTQTEGSRLTFALTKGENFGWGVCSKYLIKEAEKIIPLNIYYSDLDDGKHKDYSSATIFHALEGTSLKPFASIRGKHNIGYTFFENLLSEDSQANSKELDLVLAGSTWNYTQLLEKGITNAGVLIQGIDPDIFYKLPHNQNPELFTIFSGGKFEYRKGQDLVLKAIAILQKKYPNIFLINAWYNFWQGSMQSMSASKHISCNLRGETWQDMMQNIYIDNGIDIERVITLPITNNTELPSIYAMTDLGLFPNRCEGGTNLVLMEYMACGKPVIASFNTGHKDILTVENSIPLLSQTPFQLQTIDKIPIANWYEPSLDEIVAKIELAYHNRDAIKQIGNNAAEYMKGLTWEKSASNLIEMLRQLGFIN